MKTTQVALTKRVSVTLLDLDRDALLYPLSLAAGVTPAPDIPPGMTHDQAVLAEGDYKEAYEDFIARSTGTTNAAVLGWAMDVANIINFADESPPPSVLADQIAALDDLLNTYSVDFNQWQESPIINRGLRLTAVANGLRKISPRPFEQLQDWLSAVYRRWGVVDEKLVDNAIKSESGDGGGGASAGSGGADQARTEDAPV